MLSAMTSSAAADLAARIRPALTQLYVMHARATGSSDLTSPQVCLLKQLADGGEARTSELARRQNIQMPTASNAVHQLANRGYLDRVRDSSDRRGVRVHITDEGRAALERVTSERNQYFAKMLEVLSEEDLQELEKVSHLVLRLAEKYASLLEQTPHIEL